ncbi:MAG: hypothetical protein IAE91_08190 [Ignavibacteriaceae bacterium]|nr:hypothetical protein [Ignavibacteriaceae bacterium]
MKKMSSIKLSAFTLLLAFGGIFVTGCTSYASEEQLAALEQLKREVRSAQDNLDALKKEKANIESEISKKNAKLEECNKLKQEASANLKKLGL